jgi:tetratricopeptide (TPR) repeat protein
MLPLIWCLLAAPIAFLTAHVQQVGVIPYVPLLHRPLIAGDALAFYLRHIAFPLQLAVDYARRPSVVLASVPCYFAWLIPAAIALLIYRQRRTRPWLIAAAIAFLAPLLPVLGLRPFMMQYTSTVADHYLYLPMFGLALALAMFLAAAPSPRWTTAAAALIALLAIRSTLQTRYWHDDESLNRHTLAVTPNSFVAHINLAHNLEVKGDFQAELNEDAAAVRCNPDFPLARGNYAVMLATLGHIDQAESQCRELHRLIAPLPPIGQRVFSPTFAFVGRELLWHHHPARATALLRAALALDPNCPEASTDLSEAIAQLETSP